MSNQHKIILRLVQAGSLAKYSHLVKVEFFTADYYREIFNMLVQYEMQFNKCMSPDTFKLQWPDFDYIELTEDVEWYADELEADYLAAQLQTITQTIEELRELDPKKAILELEREIVKLRPYVVKSISSGVDLYAHQTERAKLISTRRVLEGLSGITTGFAEIDELTSGTQRGEIELLVARPGNGKSLLLLWGAHMATLQGKRVSFISPEMTAFEMGLRLDSMQHHLSMMRLQSGRMTDDEIAWYNDQTQKASRGIQFYESFSRGRFTTADVMSIVRNDAPDIVMIDGLLLVDPIKETRDTRTRLMALMEELKTGVTDTGVPIRAAHQSNRNPDTQTSKKQRDNNPLLALPELHHLAESGATEQYANRVMTFHYMPADKRMFVAIRKNRNAPSGRIFSFRYEIDTGYLTSFRLEGDERADDGTVDESLDSSSLFDATSNF